MGQLLAGIQPQVGDSKDSPATVPNIAVRDMLERGSLCAVGRSNGAVSTLVAWDFGFPFIAGGGRWGLRGDEKPAGSRLVIERRHLRGDGQAGAATPTHLDSDRGSAGGRTVYPCIATTLLLEHRVVVELRCEGQRSSRWCAAVGPTRLTTEAAAVEEATALLTADRGKRQHRSPELAEHRLVDVSQMTLKLFLQPVSFAARPPRATTRMHAPRTPRSPAANGVDL